MYAIDEDDSENIEESADNEVDLQAWRLLEESEHEQWQEVISRRDKQEAKKSQSGVIVECGEQSQLKSKENRRRKGQMGEVRVTMDSGGAGHVTPETMFPRVKLERTTTPKKVCGRKWRTDQRLG